MSFDKPVLSTVEGLRANGVNQRLLDGFLLFKPGNTMCPPPIQGSMTPAPQLGDCSHVQPSPENVQSGPADLEPEDFIDLYGPEPPDMQPSQELSSDEFEIVEMDDSLRDLISLDNLSERSISDNDETTFLPEDARLNAELGMRAERDLGANPKHFLQFVARNTNPKRAWFSFKNLLSLISDYIRGRRPAMALNMNCVHCAAAVDRTLAELSPQGGGSKPPKLYQVAERRPGAFAALMNTGKYTTADDRGNFIEKLTGKIDAGMRGCISIPVKGKPFSHAMNVVNMADSNGLYIVCGQQNRVYDLNDESDSKHFWSRYEITDGRAAYIVPTGQAPGKMISSPVQPDGLLPDFA